MADILISKFTTQIPRVGATPATPGFAESEGQDPVAPSGTPQVYTPVTIGSPANGLSIDGSQVLTIGLASTSTTGALSSTDWNTFNNKLNLTSPITGYTVGANTALADTDTILQAFGKVQGQINARISGTIASGQVAFGTGVNTVGGEAGLVWDSTNKRLSINSASSQFQINARTDGTGTTFGTNLIARFEANGSGRNASIQFSNNVDASYVIGLVGNALTFGVGVQERWRMTTAGILQSNGAQTIQTSTGELTILTGGGNGNIRLVPNGTGFVMIGNGVATNMLDINGTARIRTISNLGSAATSVLVPSATGVVSLRTLAELAADGGLTNFWTLTGSDIYRNSAVAIGRTTIPTNATFAIQSLTATGSHQFFQLLNNAGTVLASLTQNGDFAINTTPVTDTKLIVRAPTDTASGNAINIINSSSVSVLLVNGAHIRTGRNLGINRAPESDVPLCVQPLAGQTQGARFTTNAGVVTANIVCSNGNYQTSGSAIFGTSNPNVGPSGRVEIRGIGTTTNTTLLLEDSAGTDNAIFLDNGQIRFLRLPTSSAGLAAGSLWNNGGVLNIV